MRRKLKRKLIPDYNAFEIRTYQFLQDWYEQQYMRDEVRLQRILQEMNYRMMYIHYYCGGIA